MLNFSKTVVVMASVAFTVGLSGSRALAQSSDEGETRVTPGWVFTPTVSIGATHDDNPVLAGRGDPSPDDVVTNVRPRRRPVVHRQACLLRRRVPGRDPALPRARRLRQL